MMVFALLFFLQDPTGAELDDLVRGIRGFDRNRIPAPAADGEFLRRLSLNLTDAPPTADAARAYIDDPAPDKRVRAVDRLLASEAFAVAWSRRLLDVLLGEAEGLPFGEHPLPAEHRAELIRGFRAWLLQAMREDRPWDEVVRELLASRGWSDVAPAVAYKLSFRGNVDPFQPTFAGYMPKQILGIDLRCAVCHDHPFDRWRAQDTFALVGFLPGLKAEVDERLTRVRVEPVSAVQPARIFDPERLRMASEPRFFLGGEPRPGEDLLEALARLATASPQFDRAMANRIWAWMFGVGVVDPVDDFNLRNKPISAALMAGLERAFRAKGRSIKALVRTLALTQAYGRSTEGAPPTAQRVVPLSPVQLVGALETAALGAPRRDPAEARRLLGADMLVRVQGCEIAAARCGTLQALFLRNSEELRGWIADGPVLRAARASEDPLGALFLAALSRRPSGAERERFGRFVADGGVAWEDAMWVLLNSVEFLTRS